jgi:hypothetical protein
LIFLVNFLKTLLEIFHHNENCFMIHSGIC